MDPATITLEQQIQVQVEELRGKFPQTQELYREVCILLFFRHGITPTANKLYQYVRRGSMSAPAEALNRFWNDLRDRSRVRVEHPDLPDEIKAATGELAASIWAQAQATAQASLAALRSEAQALVAATRLAEESANQRLAAASADLDATRERLKAAQERIGALEQSLAAETAIRTTIEEQLRVALEANAVAHRATEDARREFSAELEKLREAGRLAEERYRVSEERALLQIDRERTATARFQKEADHARAAYAQATEQHRREAAERQAEIGRLRQQVGMLEGTLQSANAAKERGSAEVEAMRTELTKASSETAALRVEVANWRQRAEEARQAIADLQAKASQRSRKGGSGKNEGKL